MLQARALMLDAGWVGVAAGAAACGDPLPSRSSSSTAHQRTLAIATLRRRCRPRGVRQPQCAAGCRTLRGHLRAEGNGGQGHPAQPGQVWVLPCAPISCSLTPLRLALSALTASFFVCTHAHHAGLPGARDRPHPRGLHAQPQPRGGSGGCSSLPFPQPARPPSVHRACMQLGGSMACPWQSHPSLLTACGVPLWAACRTAPTTHARPCARARAGGRQRAHQPARDGRGAEGVPGRGRQPGLHE